MAHYAFLDENNIVTEVINGKDETVTENGVFWETFYGQIRNQRCLRTSYNASTNGFRGVYAGIGYTYDEENDVFVAPPLPPNIITEA
jgi:hypothetical protein